MARVNLEQRFFAEGRLFQLSEELGVPTHTAIGILAYLWHDSQELRRVNGSKREIIVWCRLREIQHDEFMVDKVQTTNEILIEALSNCGYIQLVQPDLYEITGNSDQISSLSKFETDRLVKKQIAQLGGIARANNGLRDEHGRFVPAQPATASPAAPAESSGNAMQSKAIQFNTTQYKKEKEVGTELKFDASLPVELGDPVCMEFLKQAGIKHSIVLLWLKTYEDPYWLKQEILKIVAWLDANPAKKPKKNYARFVGAWLSRGWEWHRKNLVSNKPKEKSTLEMINELEAQNG